MRYFKDMLSKGGFNDGDSTPDGIETYRDVYITAINRVAETLGSKSRAFAYDRPGCHNGCMIVFVPADVQAELNAPESVNKVLSEGYVRDMEMDLAIQQCMVLGLDDAVCVQISLDSTTLNNILTRGGF